MTADYYARITIILAEAALTTEHDLMRICNNITTRFKLQPYKPPTPKTTPKPPNAT